MANRHARRAAAAAPPEAVAVQTASAPQPTHVAIPLSVAERLVAYLKQPAYDFDTVAQLVAAIAMSPALTLEVTGAPTAAGAPSGQPSG